MTTIWVVRHGRTEMNASGAIIGQLDPNLDELGMAQAAAAADFLLDQGARVRIFSSDLARARQSAEQIGLELDVPVESDPRLREAYFGTLEGLPIASAIESGVWAERRHAMYEFRPSGGESYLEVERRLREFLEEKACLATDSILVTHIGPIRVLLVILGVIAARDVGGVAVTNGACLKFVGTTGAWRVTVPLGTFIKDDL
ncbi:MAG TPA: histidine phosphatase family protein [Polyangiaceae bacterium]|nr:histidine phosphatase family protein [Polyangiaceae bacterium]